MWRVDEDNSNPLVSDRLAICYSYLRDNGRIGKERTRKVFEQDYPTEFRNTDETITIKFVSRLRE